MSAARISELRERLVDARASLGAEATRGIPADDSVARFAIAERHLALVAAEVALEADAPELAWAEVLVARALGENVPTDAAAAVGAAALDAARSSA